MEQMQIPSEMVIDFDYRHADKIIQVLHPVVWKDGDSYCALLGPDPMAGVFGCGNTPEQATDDWQDSLKLLMDRGDDNNEVVQYVKEKLQEKKSLIA